jgi:hypothetical protein
MTLSIIQDKSEIISVLSSSARSDRASSVTKGLSFFVLQMNCLQNFIRGYHGVPLAVSLVKIKLISEFTEILSSFIINPSTTDDNILASRPERRTIFSTSNTGLFFGISMKSLTTLEPEIL